MLSGRDSLYTVCFESLKCRMGDDDVRVVLQLNL